MANVTTEMRHADVVLRGIADSLAGIGLLKHVGNQVKEAARESAYGQGGRSFWRSMGDSVRTQQDGDSVIVGAVHEAAAQKQFGGQISAPGKGPKATGAKSLTIPVGQARENRWTVSQAERVYEIFKVKGKDGRGFLFGTRRNLKKKKATLLFVLRKRVMQRAYPWFPQGQELQASIKRGIDSYIRLSGGMA